MDDVSTAPPVTPAAAPSRRAPSRRSTTALITAIAGLISAFAAFQRTPPEPTAKEGYVVLQKAFAEQSTEMEALKDDVLRLRSSFEAYARAKEGPANVTPRPEPDAPVPLAPIEVRVQSPTTATSSLVVIPSARPPTTQRPLPNVSEIESKAKGKL